jgi:hypothetical protein
MNNDSVHPARSPDFLSRLHDGELTAGERAHFESHRAHCSECRRAASEFEAALSLFRASSTSPPSTDLARRILRKLEAAAPPRRRFGIVHGIHPKWAAGFAVAVIAAVLGSAIVLEREAARKAILRQSPIPVLLQKERNQAADASKAPAEAGRSAQAAKDAAKSLQKEPYAPEPAPLPSPGAGGSSPAAPAAEPRREQPAMASREGREAAGEAADSISPRVRDTRPTRALKSLEYSGGEGASAPSIASAEPGAPARLVIMALDGEGNAPAVVSPGAPESLSGLRGRQYFLLVEAGGRVREARLDGKRPPRAARPRSKESAVSDTAPPPVWNLRFTPGDRPRRLILRLE